MSKKMYLIMFLVVAFAFNVFAQDPSKKDEMKKESTAIKALSADHAAKSALNVGAKMPSFSLKDANGKSVNSEDLLKQGSLVVVFYRGAWCPFCNLYLRKLQENISKIKAQNANLVAISVENPDRSLTVAQKNKVDFAVLSDPNLDAARRFGIVYEMPKDTNELYKSKGFDLAKYNGTEKAELPLSATYIVNQKGEIVYAFLEPDYQKRAEPPVIIETLSKLKASSNK